MTILNVASAPDCVVILQDSAVFSPAGRPIATERKTKIIRAPAGFDQPDMAFAARGTVGVLEAIEGELSGRLFFNGLDDLEDRGAEILDFAYRWFSYRASLGYGVPAGAAPGAEVVLAGMSNRRGAMTALLFRDRDGFEPREIRGPLLLPSVGEPEPVVPEIDGDAIAGWLAKIAENQHIATGGRASGGELTATTLTPDGTTVAEIGSLPALDRPQTARPRRDRRT